ncbi:VOC family protein [Lignipirellula cremea]|uniref:Glyoxalase-like domain protein n=1 Tax=Lignipirellula cremea TaxID=2528010 RepID=A0A518DT30_9BACT|nr:VOC family protein [Lignipirellula cremea]QDU94958.1 Glyoxalase-like domain protein [Lignipirellula cremea]
MSDFNSTHNRAVWFDIPVRDLERAATFYRAVLDITVEIEQAGELRFAVLEHHDGNGGCLVPASEDAPSTGGILLYLNADGRLRTAVEQATRCGGQILEPVHPIGPHGFRAIVLDSEGNRFALHSQTDG